MATQVITEPFRIAEFLVSEAGGYQSREVAIIQGGVYTPPGTVLGRITATSVLVPVAPAAADGSQTAFGVLYQGVAATELAVQRTYIARSAEVNGNVIVWPAAITAPQKTAAIAQLATLGILVRT
jgi:hypothetical protein